MSGDLTSKALRGGALSVSAKVANFVVGIAAVAILARLFTPEEYGQFAVFTLITAICGALPTAIGQALIREGSSDRGVIASYNWIFLTTLAVAVAALFAAEDVLLSFFDRTLSSAIYDWLFLVAPIVSISAFLDAKLSHAQRFEMLAVGEVVLQIFGSVASTIALSFYFSGTTALIGGTAVGYALKLTLQVWSLGIVPVLRPFDGILQRLRSVGHFAAIYGANYFGGNGDNLIVAKLLGSTELGIYSRAYNLMSKPVTALSASVSSVYFPLMVAAREKPAAFRSGYLKALSFAAMIGFPLSAYLALVSREIVVVLLGKRWEAVALPFAFLAIASYFRVAYRVTETVNLARNSLASSVARQCLYAVLIVCGSIAGSFAGVVGVAIAVAGALMVFFLVSFLNANRTADCALISCLKASTPAALGTSLAAIFMLLVLTALGSDAPLVRLLASTSFWIVYGCYWIVACKIYPSDITASLLQAAMSRSRRLLARGP